MLPWKLEWTSIGVVGESLISTCHLVMSLLNLSSFSSIERSPAIHTFPWNWSEEKKDKENQTQNQKMSCSFSLHVPKALPPLPSSSSRGISSLFIASKHKPFHNNTQSLHQHHVHVCIYFNFLLRCQPIILLWPFII